MYADNFTFTNPRNNTIIFHLRLVYRFSIITQSRYALVLTVSFKSILFSSCDNLIHYGKRVVVRLRGPFGKAVAKSRNMTWTTPEQVVPPLRPTNPLEDFQERARLLIENIYMIRDEELLWDR